MKADRSFLTWTTAALLGALLLAPVVSQAGGIHIGPVRIGIDVDRPSKKWAEALAPEIQAVQSRFADDRRALHTVKGADGKPAYLRKDMKDLIDRTAKDLDDAIGKVQPSALRPLQEWAADAIGRIQGEIAEPPGQIAAVPAGLFAPQPVEVIASLGSAPKKKQASPKPAVPPAPAAPPPDTVPTEKADSVLDEVGKVLSQIFTLAKNDDLTVTLWVGSTAPHAMFSFWPQGKIKGSMLDPVIIRTDGKQREVTRGLYFYRVTHGQGAVTEVIEYSQPAGTKMAQSERLDLVNGTGFFCCRFDEHYCHAVNDEKECR
jgi:hypothetical protein